MGESVMKASRWITMCWTLLALAIVVLGYSESNSVKVVPDDGPYFFRGPESKTVTSGERVVLSCILAKDDYQFWLSWQQDKVFLQLEDVMRDPVTYFKSPDGIIMGEYTLTIGSATIDSAGDYACVLVNGTGTGGEGEENLKVVLKSPTASLIVVEPISTSTTTSTSPPLKDVPTLEAAPLPMSTPKPMMKTKSDVNDGRELDSTVSAGIKLKSDSELEPMKVEEVPVLVSGTNPPVLETASNSGSWEPHLLYYILTGISIVALVLFIIVVALLCGWSNSTCPCSCPCEAVTDPRSVQTHPNSNFSKIEREDGARKEVGKSSAREAEMERGSSESKFFKNQEQFHPPFYNYSDELLYCTIRNPNLYQPSSLQTPNTERV